MKKYLLLSLILIPFLFPSSAQAEDYNLCNFPTTGNTTINRSCVIYEEINGVTDGDLIISNAYVTLNRTLVFPIGKKIDILNDAIVYMNTGGSIRQGSLCVKDSDHDGYAEIKTLSTDPNLGTALSTQIDQIDQVYSASGTCNTAAGYVDRTQILDINLADISVTPSGMASTVVTDREMLRLGFRIGNIVDSYAAGRPVAVYNDNLLVYSSTPSGTTFNPAYGNAYIQNKVGIGKTNPGFALDVAGTINGTALYVGGSPYIGSQWTTATNDIYYTTGKVGIGKTNPGFALDVAGTINGTALYVNGNPYIGSQWTNDANGIYYSGNVGIGTASSGTYKLNVSGQVYLAGSSKDFKENIKPLEIDPRKIYELNPVSYDYKPEYKDFGFNLASGRQFGLIAEEVAKVYPELAITLDRDGVKNKVSNVDYEKLSVILLAEMKNQKKEIDSLRQQVNDLENRLILLEQKIK